MLNPLALGRVFLGLWVYRNQLSGLEVFLVSALKRYELQISVKPELALLKQA